MRESTTDPSAAKEKTAEHAAEGTGVKRTDTLQFGSTGRLEVVYWPVQNLIPYARNPRKNDAVVGQMVASIREFGFAVPVLAKSDGVIVDGHLRLKAAQQMGMAEVPVVVVDKWSDSQVKAFRLLANRSVNWAEWDDDLLALEMADLKECGFDLNLTGFDENQLEALLAPSRSGGFTDEDTAPEVPELPVTQEGDLWVLGNHRLLCGDSTNTSVVGRLFNGVAPALGVMDPPYGVQYRPGWRNEAARAGKIAFAARREGEVANDDRADWSAAYELFPGHVLYVWHASLFGSQVQTSIERSGFELRSQIIWAKSRFAISRGHYHWQHESCFYAVRRGSNGNWRGDRRQTTLWQIQPVEGDDARNNHGTQKPVECMRRPILNHTKTGEAVYDGFVGSGTSIIAAETTQRICYAMDIDPAYIDVAVQRWEAFTGKQATLDGDGRTFQALADERRGIGR